MMHYKVTIVHMIDVREFDGDEQNVLLVPSDVIAESIASSFRSERGTEQETPDGRLRFVPLSVDVDVKVVAQ